MSSILFRASLPSGLPLISRLSPLPAEPFCVPSKLPPTPTAPLPPQQPKIVRGPFGTVEEALERLAREFSNVEQHHVDWVAQVITSASALMIACSPERSEIGLLTNSGDSNLFDHQRAPDDLWQMLSAKGYNIIGVLSAASPQKISYFPLVICRGELRMVASPRRVPLP